MVNRINQIVIVIMLLFWGCNNPENTSTLEELINAHDERKALPSRAYVGVYRWSQESILIDSVDIQGVLPIRGNKSDLIQLFDAPTKIEASSKAFSNTRYLHWKYKDIKSESIDYYWYDNISFEVIGDYYILKSVDFADTEIYLNTPKIKLSNKTALHDFIEIFPESTKLTRTSGNIWSGYIVIKVFPDSDHHWLFYFRRARLASMTLQFLPNL